MPETESKIILKNVSKIMLENEPKTDVTPKTDSQKSPATENISLEINVKNNDNLGLSKLRLDDVPEDILFPEELVQYLRGQIEVR